MEKLWWQPPEGELTEAEKELCNRQRAIQLLSETAAIEQRQAAWYELNLWNSTLYNNRRLVGFRWGAVADDQEELWPSNLRTENLVENIGQTMLAKAASSPLRPTLVPHGASWKTANHVRVADRFLYGVWSQTKAEDASLQMFNDAYTTGLGCIQVSADPVKKSVCVESVFFDNVVIDNRECGNRAEPKTYRIRKAVPRQAVESLYGIKLNKQDKPYTHHRPIGDGWEVIVEAWRLPDADGTGGYHMVACCDRIIKEEAWTHTWVPLVFFHWTDRQSGFFTKGGIEQVIPYQVRQNELNDAISEAQDIACRPRILAPASTHLDASQWDTKAGRILQYSGLEPKPLVWPTNLQELYQERATNKAAAYSHMGLSEMFAMGDVPQQVRFDSSAGLREARNMEDARHLRLWRSFEAVRLEVAKTILRVLSTAANAEEFSTVYRPNGSSLAGRTIEYKAIKHLTEDDYSWEMAPASLAQMSPAARRETLRDRLSRAAAQGGTNDPRLQTNPDLEMFEQMELASEEDIERHLEILEDGGFEAPDEMTNLPKGMLMVTANYHRLLRYKDVKRNSPMVQNHVRWVVRAASIQMAAAMPQQPTTPFQPTQGMAGTHSATQTI